MSEGGGGRIFTTAVGNTGTVEPARFRPRRVQPKSGLDEIEQHLPASQGDVGLTDWSVTALRIQSELANT